ncbi:MAG: DUF1330 domain-containing protein [Thermoleophilaceae bacterium]|nr:DUF1330 domain-containing protein [Thermoleophilaceae bacterium]
MAVDPTGEDIQRFLAEPDEGRAIVMLNLLRFAPGGGRERYTEYMLAAQPFAEKIGADPVYFGDCAPAIIAEEGQAWDAVLIVRYPSRAAFLEMVGDPGYQAITHLRTEALSEAVLQPTAERG